MCGTAAKELRVAGCPADAVAAADPRRVGYVRVVHVVTTTKVDQIMKAIAAIIMNSSVVSVAAA